MDRVVYYIVAGLFSLLSLLPLRFLRWVGGRIGDLLWYQQSISRQVTEENLQICFPDMPAAEREQLARDSLRNLGMTAMELGLMWRGSVPRVLSRIRRITGEEYMAQALAQGTGVIVLAPHIGNWELVGQYLGVHFRSTHMYQPPEHPALDRLIYKARSRSGSALAPTNTSGVKALLRVLKKGEVVAVLPDQSPPKGSGSFAPFFGLPALTQSLSYNLIQRTGARVVFIYAKRIPASSDFELVMTPPEDDIYSEDELTALSALNRGVEKVVMDVPEQYQWEYKRFRKQPNGERKYYLKKGKKQ